MAQLPQTFDPDSVSDDFALCPAGEGVAQVISSDLKEVPNVGLVLNTEYEFLDGPLKGKRAFEGFFLEHMNPQVPEIAQRSLKRLCAAVGHTGVLNNSDALHFKPFRLKVSIKPDKKGVDRNNFAYSALSTVGDAVTAGTSAPAASAPWRAGAAA